MEFHSLHSGESNRVPTRIESCFLVLKLSECFRKQHYTYDWWVQKQWLESNF